MTNFNFHASRNAARTSLTEGFKFKDLGPTAEKGKRWATYAVATPEATNAEVTEKAPTKKSLATGIYANLLAANPDTTYTDIEAAFVADAGLTKAGARTYRANFTSGKWTS